MFTSVNRRINEIKQPKDGYVKVDWFSASHYEDGRILNGDENIYPLLVGLAVDYLTRYMMGAPIEKAFEISIMGAVKIHEEENAAKLLSRIRRLDADSVDAACKMVGYDVCYRVGASRYKPVENIVPDNETCENIKILVERCYDFWEVHGPLVKSEITFEGGYTPFIMVGDGDYLTKDTIWDFKVSKKEPQPKYTLQLLVYYLMGKHSVYREYDCVDKIGLFNPRLNKSYVLEIRDIPQDIIDAVSHDVIGYNLSEEEERRMNEETNGAYGKVQKMLGNARNIKRHD